MKKFTTIVTVIILLIFGTKSGSITAKAATTVDLKSKIMTKEVSESADVNDDGKVNIVDLIRAKNLGVSGQQKLVTDVLSGKKIKRTYDDFDDVGNISSSLLFDVNDRPVRVFQMEEAYIAEFYNTEKYELKTVKLENQFGVDTSSKFMGFDINSQLPWVNGIVTCYLSVDRNGRIGWSADSFIYRPEQTFELNKMDATVDNISLIKSILSGWDLNKLECFTGDNFIEVVFSNDNENRKVRMISTEVTDIEEWFFSTSTIGQKIIFGISEGKLNVNLI